MKNKIYFFDTTCNSAYDEFIEVCNLRQKHNLTILTFKLFLKRCNKPTETQFDEWKNQNPHSKMDFVFCYTEEMFLKN